MGLIKVYHGSFEQNLDYIETRDVALGKLYNWLSEVSMGLIKIYHGSFEQNLKYIETRISLLHPILGSMVFGSYIAEYAAIFCLQWNRADVEIIINSRKLLTNNKPCNCIENFNSVRLILNKNISLTRPCSIYEIEDSGFCPTKTTNGFEVYSMYKAKVLNEIKFDEFNDVAKRYNIEIIHNRRLVKRLEGE